MSKADNFIEKRTVKTVRDFKGINSSPFACDGDIVEAYNISTRNYPAMSSAIPHTVEVSYAGDQDSVVGCTDKIFYSAKSKFIYDNCEKGTISTGRKNFCTLNGIVSIFPDKKFFRFTPLIYRPQNGKLIECDSNEQYENIVDIIAISNTAPSKAYEGDVYYDSGNNYLYVYTNGEWLKDTTPDYFKRYRLNTEEFGKSDTEFVWTGTENKYYEMTCIDNEENVKFSFVGSSGSLSPDFKGLKVGDVVTVTGAQVYDSLSQDLAEGLSEGTVITDIGKHYITVKNTAGITLSGAQKSEVLKIKRFVPTMTCVTTVGNRLWGASGKTIFASAPNNPLLWSKKNGLSDKTVTIDTGISGSIIACADFGGIPLFFTENSIIKVISVYDGYKLSITPAESVSPENTNSIAVVADSLYYVSKSGIMCYKGTVPVKIDAEIGLKYYGTVGGSDGARYFISDDTNTYIYDPDTKLWSCENGSHYSFARCGSLFLATGKYYSGTAIFRIMSKHENFSYEFAHYPGNTQIIFAPFYENTPLKKTFSKLIIGTRTEIGTITDVYVSFDGKPYVFAGCIKGKRGVCVSEIPLIPVRADYMQVKIVSHSGELDLISLSREFVTHDNYN